jgi:dGTP triphosphohydrolase
MTMQEITQELMKHINEYAVESIEKIPVGTKQRKTHRKHRINKKWAKRYGYETVYEEKKCKKIEVTTELIVEFCFKYGYPLPDELRGIINQIGDE